MTDLDREMNTHANDCLELMQTLIEYRYQKDLHNELVHSAAKHSMLGIDVLVLLYHFAKMSVGDILEIGAFIGGSTIAIAMGARDSGKEKKIISIEPGGHLVNHRLATRDIFKDLKKNLKSFGLLERVNLVNGRSFEKNTIDAVRAMSGQIGLFLLDADGNVRRDIDCYSDRFLHRCWVVIDDYLGPAKKSGPTRDQVNELINTGRLEPLGLYGWGTWIGRWLGK
jgi:predicted O-methyltransferase YrrM